MSKFASCDETHTMVILKVVQGYFEAKLTLRARRMAHFCCCLFGACLFLFHN